MDSRLIEHVVRQNNWSWCKQRMLHLSLFTVSFSAFTYCLLQQAGAVVKRLQVRYWPRCPSLTAHGNLSSNTQRPTPPRLHQDPAALSLQVICGPQSKLLSGSIWKTSSLPRNGVFICSGFFEWHCPVELLKWWSILAAQTSTNLNCSNCNCWACFKLLT